MKDYSRLENKRFLLDRTIDITEQIGVEISAIVQAGEVINKHVERHLSFLSYGPAVQVRV